MLSVAVKSTYLSLYASESKLSTWLSVRRCAKVSIFVRNLVPTIGGKTVYMFVGWPASSGLSKQLRCQLFVTVIGSYVRRLGVMSDGWLHNWYKNI